MGLCTILRRWAARSLRDPHGNAHDDTHGRETEYDLPGILVVARRDIRPVTPAENDQAEGEKNGHRQREEHGGRRPWQLK